MFRTITLMTLLQVALQFAFTSDLLAADDLRAIKGLLAGIDTVPTKGQFQAASGDPAKDLAAIANDVSEQGYLRLRAVGFLGYFHSDPRVWPQMASWVKSGQVDLRAFAAKATAHAYGKKRPRHVMALLTPLLRDKSPTLNVAAIHALSTLQFKGSDPIRALLKSEWVKAKGNTNRNTRNAIAEALRRRAEAR